MKNIIILLFLFSFFISSAQESPYELDWNIDGTILGGSFSMCVASLIVEKKQDEISTTEILILNSSDVNSFDRFATRQKSHSFELTSHALLLSSGVAPFSLLATKKTRKDFLTIGVMGLETFLLTYGFTNINKVAVLRERPLLYNPSFSFEEKLEKDNRYSFFSGHTSVTASSFFFTAKVLTDYYPNSKWKPFIWTIAAIVPAITGYARVRAGKHFPTDVIVGYLVGAGTGILIPHIHKIKKNKDIGFYPL